MATLAESFLHDLDDLDDEECCVVCCDKRRDTVLVPCGHVVLCSGCCDDVVAATNECPVCRHAIEESVHMG